MQCLGELRFLQMVPREGVEGTWGLEFHSCGIWDPPWSSHLCFREPESSGLGLWDPVMRLRVVLEV